MPPASSAAADPTAAAAERQAASESSGRALGRDFVVTTLAQVAVAVGGLFLYRLLAREKGADSVASYALIKQVVIFLLPAAMLGMQTGVPRYIALDRERERASERYLLAAATVTVLTTAALSAAVLVSRRGTAEVLFGDPDRTSLVIPLIATLAATIAFEVTYGYFRGRSAFALASVARIVAVAALPVVLLVVIPGESIGKLITLMAVGLLLTCVLLAGPPLLRALLPLRPRDTLASARTLLNYGLRRVPGEYAAVILLAVPTVVAAHVAPLREVAYLTAGMYVLAVVTIAFQPVGLVFLPFLSRLCATDFEEARRWVAKLAACALHVSIYATPQILLFADVLVEAWLGPQFRSAGAVIRITLAPVAMYVVYLLLRNALDAVAVKAYNARNNLIALAAAGAAASALLEFDVGQPVEAIAASFAIGIACLGGLTLASVHQLFRIGTSDYALKVAIPLGLAAAAVGAGLRLTAIHYGSPPSLFVALAAVELGLGALYFTGLVKAGVTWPADIRNLVLARRNRR
jgi:O-antigen/teichoic acid export membrane protein